MVPSFLASWAVSLQPTAAYLPPALPSGVPLFATQPLFTREPGPARKISWAESTEDSLSPTFFLGSHLICVK